MKFEMETRWTRVNERGRWTHLLLEQSALFMRDIYLTKLYLYTEYIYLYSPEIYFYERYLYTELYLLWRYYV